MIRCALFCLLGAMAAQAGEANAPSGEQADLQAAMVVEAALMTRTAGGGDEREALGRLDQVFAGLEAKYPRSAVIRDEHGSFLWWEQREGEAFAKWHEAEQRDGGNPNICQHLGSALLESGQIVEGIGYLERAASLAPSDATLQYTLGTDLYLFRHQMTTAREPEAAVVDRALAALRRAVEIDPTNASYAEGYAQTFYSIPIPRWPEAIQAWQHLYDISGKKDFAAINLARVSLLMHDGAAARGYLEKVHSPAFEALKTKLMAHATSM